MTYKGYLIDLDGTIYKGKDRIPEGEAFVKELQKRQIPYLFVTNNSMRTPEMVQELLRNQCELETPLETIYTATLATVDYMNDMNRGQTIVVGDNYLTDITAGIKNDFPTLLVTTGFTKAEEVAGLPVKPDHVLASLSEWDFDAN